MIKILIVDDNEVLADLIKAMLEVEKSYHVMTAENGGEGYAAFLTFKPDVILTDIEMPVKDGLEMVKDIRVHQPSIKAIYMSADLTRYRSSLEKEKAKYKAALLDKPFTISQVMGLFDEYQIERGC